MCGFSTTIRRISGGYAVAATRARATTSPRTERYPLRAPRAGTCRWQGSTSDWQEHRSRGRRAVRRSIAHCREFVVSATAESVKALDNQITSAKGESPLMYARQGGTHPDAEKKGMSDAWEWAHKRAPLGVKESWPAWKKSEHTGVHAEMLIVRAWMVQIVIEGKHTIAEAMAMLKG